MYMKFSNVAGVFSSRLSKVRFQLEQSDLTEGVSGRERRALRESMLEGNSMVVGALPIRDVGARNLFAT